MQNLRWTVKKRRTSFFHVEGFFFQILLSVIVLQRHKIRGIWFDLRHDLSSRETKHPLGGRTNRKSMKRWIT